jgi:hypothetical protein
MRHPERAFSFSKIESEDDLMEVMFKRNWPLCHGFHHGTLLYLSDGEGEELPEYAVVTIDKTEGRFDIHGREVGRIKPMNMRSVDALKTIRELNAGNYNFENPVQVVVEPKWHHRCQLCTLEEES